MEHGTVSSLLRCIQAYCDQLCDKHTLDFGIAYYCERFPEVAELNQLREVMIGEADDVRTLLDQAQAWFAQSGLNCYRWAPAMGTAPQELSEFLIKRGFERCVDVALRLTEWVELEASPEVRVLPARAMRSAYRESLEAVPPPTGSPWSAHVAEACEDRLDDPSYDMFVALVNKEPAGRSALYQVGDLAHVRDLTVLPEFADRGVERTLLAHVLALAKRLELAKVMAHVAKDDAVRLAWFQHAGFVPAGEMEEFRRDPVVVPDSAA